MCLKVIHCGIAMPRLSRFTQRLQSPLFKVHIEPWNLKLILNNPGFEKKWSFSSGGSRFVGVCVWVWGLCSARARTTRPHTWWKQSNKSQINKVFAHLWEVDFVDSCVSVWINLGLELCDLIAGYGRLYEYIHCWLLEFLPVSGEMAKVRFAAWG